MVDEQTSGIKAGVSGRKQGTWKSRTARTATSCRGLFYSIWAKEYIDFRCVIDHWSMTAGPSRYVGYMNLRAARISSSVNYICNRYTAFYILDCEICPWIPVHIPSNISYHFILSKVCRFPNSRFWSFQTRPIASLSIIGQWFIDYESNFRDDSSIMIHYLSTLTWVFVVQTLAIWIRFEFGVKRISNWFRVCSIDNRRHSLSTKCRR